MGINGHANITCFSGFDIKNRDSHGAFLHQWQIEFLVWKIFFYETCRRRQKIQDFKSVYVIAVFLIKTFSLRNHFKDDVKIPFV